MRRMPVLALLPLALGCDSGGDPVRLEVTEARMLFCAGTFNGSTLRFTVTNDSGGRLYPLRVETAARPEAGVGTIEDGSAFAADLVLEAGDTAVLCGDVLPGPLRSLDDPPTVPIDLRFVHRLEGDGSDRTLVRRVDVTMDYRAEPCARLPADPCAPTE